MFLPVSSSILFCWHGLNSLQLPNGLFYSFVFFFTALPQGSVCRLIFFYQFNCTDPGLQLGDRAGTTHWFVAVDLLIFYMPRIGPQFFPAIFFRVYSNNWMHLLAFFGLSKWPKWEISLPFLRSISLFIFICDALAHFCIYLNQLHFFVTQFQFCQFHFFLLGQVVHKVHG